MRHGQASVFKLLLAIMSNKHAIIFLVISTGFLFTSCLGIDTNVRISAEGNVDLALRYEVSIVVDQIGKLGANEKYLPLPVGRDDLLLAVSRAGGELLTWERQDSSDRFTIDTTIRFPELTAFAAFLDPSGQVVSYSENGNLHTLTMQLSNGLTPADEELTRFIETVFSDYQTSLTFTLPAKPITTSNLTVTDLQASFSMPSAQLYTSVTPIELVLEW